MLSLQGKKKNIDTIIIMSIFAATAVVVNVVNL
jgi:hypothetical protein